jgi:tRNA (guanine-N7-)-methyltransferase
MEKGALPQQQEEAAELAACTAAHEAWIKSFAASKGRRPARQDIVADAAAGANWARMRALTIAVAPPPVVGQCRHFVWRKRRFCASRAGEAAEGSDGSFCSVHAPKALAQLREESLRGQRQHAEAAAAAAKGGDSDAGCAPGQLGAGSVETVGGAAPPRRAGRRTRGIKTNLDRAPKRMANPLSRQYQTPAPTPPWANIYSNSERSLFLDIGCARGRFLQQMARKYPRAFNYCGVEIFAPLVAAANSWTSEHGLDNLHFLAANINVSLRSLCFPRVGVVCLQFPDPWHTKHAKRRVMSDEFATELAALLPAGALFYASSDHHSIASHIREVMLSTGQFEPAARGGTGGVLDEAGAWLGLGDAAEVPHCDDDGNDDQHKSEHDAAAAAAVAAAAAAAAVPTAGQVPQTTIGARGDEGDREGNGEGDGDGAIAAHPFRKRRRDENRTGSGYQQGGALPPRVEDGWLLSSPFGVPTERDRVAELTWRPVWRMLLVRKRQQETTADGQQEPPLFDGGGT